MDARIKGALDLTLPAEVRNAPPLPDSVQGVIRPRQYLVELLHIDKRTLQRWDSRGYAAYGLPWVKGWRDSDGNMVYDMGKLWPTLNMLLERNNERMEAIELARAHERENQAFLEEQAADPSEAS